MTLAWFSRCRRLKMEAWRCAHAVQINQLDLSRFASHFKTSWFLIFYAVLIMFHTCFYLLIKLESFHMWLIRNYQIIARLKPWLPRAWMAGWQTHAAQREYFLKCRLARRYKSVEILQTFQFILAPRIPNSVEIN